MDVVEKKVEESNGMIFWDENINFENADLNLKKKDVLTREIIEILKDRMIESIKVMERREKEGQCIFKCSLKYIFRPGGFFVGPRCRRKDGKKWVFAHFDCIKSKTPNSVILKVGDLSGDESMWRDLGKDYERRK
jgi:hypothetical protein